VSPQKKSKAKPHSLESVARRELGIELDKEHQASDWCGELSPAMLGYAAKDAQVLLPLAETFVSKIKDAGLEMVAGIEHRALPAVVWMQNAGVPFDAEAWREHLKEVEQEKLRLEEQLDRLAPGRPDGKKRNWNSPQQVKEAFGLLGVDLPNTKEETLRRCDHPLAEVLLCHRGVSKILSTYGISLLEELEDGRLYGSWHQIGAETGRMSCSKRNLQQLPPLLKRYVRALEGRALVAADYSQAELRIAARISGDKQMLEAYRNGEDLHAATARSLMGRGNISKEERGLAKAVNFGLLYGQGAAGLQEYARNKYGVRMTLEEAKHYRRRFFQTYPGLKAWHESQWRRLKQGITRTRTLSGRRRTGVRNFTERVNTPVQGTGADGLKLTLALLYERRHECPGAFPITCVHDEIVVECDEENVEAAVAWLERAMKDGMAEVLALGASEDLRVPVEVEVKSGKTWGGDLPSSEPAPEPDEEEELALSTHLDDDRSARIKAYIDYRAPSADVYPLVDVCDECAEEFNADLGEQGVLQPGEVARCEICGAESASARSLSEQGRGVGYF
jgi:DNA polymerase-1